MKKLIRPQDILFLALAGIGDIFEEMRDPLMLVGKAYENVYGFIPRRYKKHNFLRSVIRSLETGYIEKIEKDGEVYLRLTSQGTKKVYRDFSLVSLSKKQWDRKWRIVFFDIEEISRTTRNRLRLKLKELGFGMLQKSVWVTPHDIMADFYEFIKEANLEKQVFVIEGETLLAGEVKKLAEKIWQLNELNKKYLNLEKEIEKVKQLSTILCDRTKNREANSKNNRDNLRAKLEKMKRETRMDYLKILVTDPHLPKELLPDNWTGKRMEREIKKFGNGS